MFLDNAKQVKHKLLRLGIFTLGRCQSFCVRKNASERALISEQSERVVLKLSTPFEERPTTGVKCLYWRGCLYSGECLYRRMHAGRGRQGDGERVYHPVTRSRSLVHCLLETRVNTRAPVSPPPWERTSDLSNVADVSTGGDKLPQGSDNRGAFVPVPFICLSPFLPSFSLALSPVLSLFSSRSFSAISHSPSPSVSLLFAHIRTHTMRLRAQTRTHIHNKYIRDMAVCFSLFLLRATSMHRFNGFS